MTRRYRWYFSAAAIREYLVIAGLPDDDGGPAWGRAERELAAHAEAARHVQDQPDGKALYRTGRRRVGDRPKSTKLEFTIGPGEGELDALIHVRDKGR